MQTLRSLFSSKYLTVVIIVSAIILRFWMIPERFIFDIDTQYLSLFADTLVDNFHVLWIGVSAGSTGYYLGPGLIYLTAGLLKLSGGDPVVLGYAASLVGALTIFSLYFVTKDLFNKNTAVISSVLYGFSYFTLNYDRKFWPLAIPLVGVWLYFSLVKAHRNSWWLLLSIMLVATAYHLHLSLLLFWPLILWTIWKMRNTLTWKKIAGMFTVYFVITAPMLVFDFLHNFDNLLTPLRLLQGGGEGSINFATSFSYLPNLIGKIFFFRSFSMTTSGIMLIIILTVMTKLWRKSKSAPNIQYITVFLTIYMFAVFFYPGTLQEYYGVLLSPFLFLMVSLYLQKLKLRYCVPLLVLFVAFNLNLFLKQTDIRGLEAKGQLIKKVMVEIGDREYYLAFDGLDYEGWRYLFQAYGNTPAQSDADSQFGWLYQSDISSSKPELTVYVTGDKLLNRDFRIMITHEGYNAYIIEN